MAEHDNAHLSAVAIKLPPFWPENAAVWLLQAEAQFATRNITIDATKYFHVVAALDQETATRVLDILQHPPEQNKYQALKNRLLSTFTLTESQRAAALLDLPGLGDDKPSKLMDTMLALLGNHTPCFLFLELFLRHMPQQIRQHLVRSDIKDPRQLALAADTLWDSARPTLNALRPSTSPTRTRQHNRSRVRYRSSPTPASRTTNEICFFHRRFGEAARQCRPPCNFHPENFLAGRQ